MPFLILVLKKNPNITEDNYLYIYSEKPSNPFQINMDGCCTKFDGNDGWGEDGMQSDLIFTLCIQSV